MGALSDDHECAFRRWDSVTYEGKSKLYTDAWNEWPTAVQDAQCLAKDGQPFNDNPAPAVADSGLVCENQDMTSGVLHERVFGRSHVVVFRTKTIIMDATNRQEEETSHGLDATTLPQIRQGMMSSVADMNYYGEPGSEEWSFAATVISSSVRGDTFMSPMHTNSLKPGRLVDHGQVHWISARGSIVDDLATTKAQMKKIAEFGSKVIAARHGSDAPGEEGLSELVLLGDDFNDEMLKMLDELKNSYKTTKRAIGGSIRTMKVPLLYRLVVVNPNGFTNDMKERLFGTGKVFEGRVPVRSFTGIIEEIEVVVFPVALSTFWPNEAYGHYSHDFLSICTAYSESLDVRIGHLKNKRYVNEDLKKFVTRIWRLKTRAAADNTSAAGSESHNDQGSASAALGVAILGDNQALQRNVLQKSDLNECGETSVPVKLFEIGPCTDSSCKYAGPAGFGCACGKGVFKSHVRVVPKERFRFRNEFLDSSSDSESSSDESLSDESSSSPEDDSRVRKRKLAAAKSVNKVKKPKRRRSEEVETLKKQYHQKFGELPKGRYASDVAWLKLKLSE